MSLPAAIEETSRRNGLAPMSYSLRTCQPLSASCSSAVSSYCPKTTSGSLWQRWASSRLQFMSRNNLLTWYRLIAYTSFSLESLQHLGPPLAKRDEVENLHPPGAKLPRPPHPLVLVVQPARADHALLPLHTAVLEA